VTSYKDSSNSNEKIVPFKHGTTDTNEETIQGNYKSLLQEKLEGSLEEQEETSSHDNSPMGGSLVGEDTTENLEQGYIEVPTVEDKLVAMQGETTSSTESIVSTYLDADDSEIKEVVIEDKPGQRESRPDVQLLDGTNIETSKNDNMQMQIPHDKEENRAISKTATVKLMIESDEALEDDNTIHGLGNQDEDNTINTLCGNLYNDEVVAKCQPYLKNPIAINDPELGNEQNERVVGSRQSSSSVTTTMEHNGTESIYKEEGIVEKNITVWNLEDNFAAEKEPEEYYGNLVSIAEVNGKEFTSLQSSLSDHHHIVNEEIQRKVNGVTGIVEFDKETVKEILEEDKVNNVEGLGLHFDAHVVAKEGGDLSNLPKAIPSTPLQSLEDIDREVYRKGDKQETITNPQGDQSQQILLEKYEVLKVENGEILRKCMQLVGDSSNVIISTDGINHEKVDTNTRSSDFTFEANQYQKEVTESTAAASFTAQCNQVKVTSSVDTATEEQHPLQTSTPGREASEVTSLLQGAGFSNSIEQHSQVHVEIPTTDIAVMQFKAEAEDESESSPLLSPREPSGGDFRIPNHSARFKKPFQSLLTKGEAGTWSPLKEPESNSKSNTMVSSPRSKEKQKARSSLFTSCMCCTTATN
jgi:mannosidase alpha-like ER degradation enhancer 2